MASAPSTPVGQQRAVRPPGSQAHPQIRSISVKYFIALRASAAVPPLICALEADLGGTGAGGRAVVYGAAGNAAGARPR